MPRSSFVFLLLTLCITGLAPLSIYLDTSIYQHVTTSIALCLLLSAIFLVLSAESNNLSVWVRKYVLGAIFFRLALLNTILIWDQITGSGIYGFIDDEFYETTWLAGGLLDERNIYVSFSLFIGNYFGNYSALILRGINIVLSSFVAFPMICILQRLDVTTRSTKFAVLALLFSPYSAAHSIFSIKDLVSAFFLTTSLWLVIRSSTTRVGNDIMHFTLPTLLSLLCLSLLLEGLRTGQGFATMATAVFALASPLRRRISPPLIVIIFVPALAILSSWAANNIDTYLLHADRYMRWISTQVAAGDFRAFFIVDTLAEIWKVPLAFSGYILGPIPQPSLSGRFMIDNGGWLKIFDFPIIIFFLLGLLQLKRRLLPFFLPVLIPLLFSAIWNVSNFRAQLAYYPAIYILFGMLLDNNHKKAQWRKWTSAILSTLATGLVIYRLL